jgi:hypothetical protein
MCLQPAVYHTVVSHMVFEMSPLYDTYTVSARPAKASKVGTVTVELRPCHPMSNGIRCGAWERCHWLGLNVPSDKKACVSRLGVQTVGGAMAADSDPTLLGYHM